MNSKANIPSLGVSGQINLRDETERSNFLKELQDLVTKLSENYGAKDFDHTDAAEYMNFKFVMACYPHPVKD